MPSKSALDEKTSKAQLALGTMKRTFTITQPLILTLNLDIVQEIETNTREDAIKQFKEDLDKPEVIIKVVEEKLSNMIDKYNYSRKEDFTIPRAAASARAGMKEEDILIIKVQDTPKEKD